MTGALARVGRMYSVEALVNELLVDEAYYQKSKGGVTFTGGEPMEQQAFLVACLKRLRDLGLSCAMETNLSYPFESYRSVLPYLDLLMVDVKCADSQKHREATGIGNEKILYNLALLLESQWARMPVIVRTPVLPGFNDDEASIASIAALLKPLENLMYYELLAYHPLGEEKSRKLGFNATSATETPSKEKMLSLGRAARRILPNVRINGVTVKA